MAPLQILFVFLLSRFFENITWLTFCRHEIQIKYISHRENIANNSQKNVISSSKVNNFLIVIVKGVPVRQMINLKK